MWRPPSAPTWPRAAATPPWSIPLGNVVILRQGRSDAGPSAFGWLHALLDHNIDDFVIERIVSSAPTRSPRRDGVMDVWIEVDRSTSTGAPDQEPFGVAYCKVPVNPNPENKRPEWVNDSLRI